MHAFIPIVALLGLAAAQSETTNTASGTSSSTDPTATCLAACKAGDVNCQAQCVNVPFPDESQINATLACSTNECSQGDGGPSDTKKYGDCLASCAADFYYTSGATPTGVATANTLPTGSSSPGSSSAETTTGSGSSASATGGSSSSSSETGSSDDSEGASSTASGASDSASSSASGSAGAAESTGAANALSLSNEMITVSGGVFGLVVAALAL